MVHTRDEMAVTSRRGRPRIDIQEQQLRFLVEANFRIEDIAAIFGCSRSTIQRRQRECGIRSSDFSILSDVELDESVGTVVLVHPQCGERSVTGYLRSQDLHIQRERIRQSIRRVDPLCVEERARCVLYRRRYNVEAPNSMWHLDGYHKLIRWRIVIHGAIDGYSRLIMFLRVSTNNRSDTVMSAFSSAIEEYGLPSCIRTDRGGGENIRVAQFMLEHGGPDTRSVIVGRSVHNQRIERLWRDLYSSCICLFYNFNFLEDLGLLDPNSEIDIYVVHLTFLPSIQKQLDIFQSGWASHPLRTERNRTPLQLWILGLMQIQNPASREATSIVQVGIIIAICAVLKHNI